MVKPFLQPPLEEELRKLMSGDIKWFVAEIDAHTPSIPEKGTTEHRKINRRLLFLIEKILTIAKEYFSKPQQKKLIQALRYFAKKHIGVYRKNERTPYIHHPLEVTVILIDLGIYDFKIIIAAILHDVPEDTDTPIKEISALFGSGVKNIVSLVTVPADSIEKQQYLSFVKIGIDALFWINGEKIVNQMKKPFDIMKKQQYWSFMKNEPDLNCRWRVIVLKYADRIHNVITLGAMSEEKRRYKLQETVQEFPLLFDVLEKTMIRLYVKGTIKNKKLLDLPRTLKKRLEDEMSKHL